MSLETRLNRLEQLSGASKEGVYCQCPVIWYPVGVNSSDFYAKHACGKPINREDVSNDAIFETRVLYPFYEQTASMADAEYLQNMAEQYEQRTRPPSEGRRLFLHDFSGQDPDAVLVVLEQMAEDGKF